MNRISLPENWVAVEREHLQNIDVSWGHEPERKHKGAAAFGVRRACSRFSHVPRRRQAGRTPNASRIPSSIRERHGSWKTSTIAKSSVGTMNQRSADSPVRAD